MKLINFLTTDACPTPAELWENVWADFDKKDEEKIKMIARFYFDSIADIAIDHDYKLENERENSYDEGYKAGKERVLKEIRKIE